MKTWYGIPASGGVAVGKVRLCGSVLPDFPKMIDATDSESVLREYEKFLTARARCVEWLKRQNSVDEEMRDVYCELLEDESLEEEVRVAIETDSMSVIAAVAFVLENTAEEMSAIEDEYARQRSDDLRTLQKMLMRALLGIPFEEKIVENEPFLLVGEDVSPLDWLNVDARFLRGIVSGAGAKTSHIALLATSREIPAVLGLGTSVIKEIHAGVSLFIDGNSGCVILEPDEETCQKAFMEDEAEKRALSEIVRLPNLTPDGRKFSLMANIATEEDISVAEKYGADGVGLFRTEFLLGGEIPLNEEEQYAVYARMARKLVGKPFTIRTFDVGADKPIPAITLPAEQNPFLGVRGCRVYMKNAENREFFLTQLRAILRASTLGNVRIMFPMITSATEVETLLSWVEEAKKSLSARKIPFGNPKIGVMIETPAAVLIVEELAEKVDFFSIGTNDLTQYTLAADRGNPSVSSLFTVPHPAVLRLIEQTITIAHQHEKHVSICGEMASDPQLAKTFLEYGLDVWSMAPAKIPGVKQKLRGAD